MIEEPTPSVLPSTVLTAGEPLEPPGRAVGHVSTTVADASRGNRTLPVDCWYPAEPGAVGATSAYELLPGVAFTASATENALPVPGRCPLVVWSHGRVGTRSSYVMLCEGLAQRGYTVIASDHPGDTLFDWMTGTAVDDATNESQRVGDVSFLLGAVHRGELRGLPEVDLDAIAIAGHSYGAWTAYACAGGDLGRGIRAVAGLEPFTRTLPRRVLKAIDVPALLVAGAQDRTTPPATDADRAFAAFGSADARRVDIADAGHQACSDVGLYLELAPQVAGIPDLVAGFISSMAADVTGTPDDPWRPAVRLHLEILGGWLDEVMGTRTVPVGRGLAAVAERPGVTVRPDPR